MDSNTTRDQIAAAVKGGAKYLSANLPEGTTMKVMCVNTGEVGTKPVLMLGISTDSVSVDALFALLGKTLVVKPHDHDQEVDSRYTPSEYDWEYNAIK